MKRIEYLMIVLMVIILGIIVTSCEGTNNNFAATQGKLSIKITDAPMEYDQFKEVSITIDKIEIRKFNNNKDSDIIVLSETPFTVNMLNLVNGITKTITDATLPVGDYDMIRVYFSSSKMILMNGKIYQNEMDYDNHNGDNNWNNTNHNWNDGNDWGNNSSWSGNMMNRGMMNGGMMMNGNNKSIDIPINPYFTVGSSMNETFLIDLDINQSFQCNDMSWGNNGSNWMDISGYEFLPVMRVVKMSETGTISGKVQNGMTNLADTTVYLMKGDKLYTTTHSDENGNYKFIGIPKGSYTIDFELKGYIVDRNQWNNNVQMNVGDLNNVNCSMKVVNN